MRREGIGWFGFGGTVEVAVEEVAAMTGEGFMSSSISFVAWYSYCSK